MRSLDQIYWDSLCTATCGCKALSEALQKHPGLRELRDGPKRKGGRPRVTVDVIEVMRMRDAGLSWPIISRKTKLGRGTLYRAVTAYMERIKPSQNSELRNVGGRPRRDGTPAKRQPKPEQFAS